MSYNRQKKQIRDYIDNLKKISEILREIEEEVVAIEDDMIELDNALPDNAELAVMKDGTRKADLMELVELLNEAYGLVDEILGPPEEGLDVEDLLRTFPVRGNGHLS